jgi:hypothetical protein
VAEIEHYEEDFDAVDGVIGCLNNALAQAEAPHFICNLSLYF